MTERCTNCGQPYHAGAAPYGCFVDLAVRIERLWARIAKMERDRCDFVEVPWPRFRLSCPAGHSTADHTFSEVKR